MAATEVTDMIRLVNKAFQCLNIYNLDLGKTYYQVFNLLCLWRKFLALKGPLKKLLPSDSTSLELEDVIEQLDYLQGVSLQIVNKLGDVSRSIDVIQFTIWKVTLL